jgi:hypothetical protein
MSHGGGTDKVCSRNVVPLGGCSSRLDAVPNREACWGDIWDICAFLRMRAIPSGPLGMCGGPSTHEIRCMTLGRRCSSSSGQQELEGPPCA